MKNQIQLILATIGLTVLIWVYADQQGWKTVEFPVTVSIAAPQGYVPRIVGTKEDEPTQTANVMVVARGPNSAIRGLTLPNAPAFKVPILISEENIAPEMEVYLRDPITAALLEKGLQFVSIKRPSISAVFDRWERITVAVQADAGTFTEAVQGSLLVEPASLTVMILSSELKEVTASQDAIVLSVEDQIRSQRTQSEFSFQVSLKDRKWQGRTAVWEPEVVQIRGRLQKQYDDLELKLIPLRTMLPWDWPSDKYQVVWADERDRLQKVQLKIPVGKPRVLTSTDVVAFISVDESLIPPQPLAGATVTPATQPAAEPSPYSQTVRFVFPEGFEDVKMVGPPSVVKFRVVKRTQATSPAVGEVK